MLEHRLRSVDVTEVFSPPRVTAQAKKFGLKVGDAWDLTTGWDFNLPSHRHAAEQYADRVKPLVIIGSPPCTPFSQLQTLNRGKAGREKKWDEGVEHMRFVIKLYQKQMEAGRVFLHERPRNATSWMLDEVRRMMTSEGVTLVEANECMFGLTTWGDQKSKLTGSMIANNEPIFELQTATCSSHLPLTLLYDVICYKRRDLPAQVL